METKEYNLKDNDNYQKPTKILDLIVKINGVIYNIEMNNNSERT